MKAYSPKEKVQRFYIRELCQGKTDWEIMEEMADHFSSVTDGLTGLQEGITETYGCPLGNAKPLPGCEALERVPNTQIDGIQGHCHPSGRQPGTHPG